MRTTSIDTLRGIAILGILFMNIPFHSHILMGYVPFDPSLPSDQIMSLFNSIFADGRFRTLFCILFGAGLAIQYEACKRNGVDSTIFLKTRLNWLILFGFIHGIFIFGGDILLLYGITGLIFIKGLSLKTPVLLSKARKFIIIGCVASLLFAGLAIAFAEYDVQVLRGSDKFVETMTVWERNYISHTIGNASVAIGLLFLVSFFIVWQVLGLMYLGAFLYRNEFFKTGFTQATLIKVATAAIISTALAVAPQLIIDDLGLSTIPLFSSISAVFVALIYAHIMVKLSHTPGAFMRLLIAPGKLAFSLYIFQSLALGLLLRWIMPEFALTVTLLDYFLLATLFTVIQIALANIYLRFAQRGPLEILWRACYSKSVEKKLKANIVAHNING